jgi:hypothetical protein
MCGEQPDVTIKVGTATFKAHSYILRMFSSCARGMPEPFTEWDLDALTIFNGKPPSAKAVGVWLDTLYWRPLQGDAKLADLTEAVPILQFVDAIGSPSQVANAIVDGILQCNRCLVVPNPYQSSTVRLPLHATCLIQEADREVTVVVDFKSSKEATLIESTYHRNARVMIEACQMAAAQAFEELFFWAHKLQLMNLGIVLHDFLGQHLPHGSKGILHGQTDAILTPRVLEVLDGAIMAEGWVRSG